MSAFEDLMTAADRRLDGLPLEAVRVEAGGRMFQFMAVRNHDRLLKAAQDFDEFPFGVLLWDSAVVLAQVLAETAFPNGAAVLELGAGAGAGGIVAAALGARVVQTDHSFEALALSRRNAAANDVRGIALRNADWRRWTDRQAYDAVIAADILYDPGLYPDILRVLEVAVRPGGRVMLTDPGRVCAREFVRALGDAGWRVHAEGRTADALPASGKGDSIAVDLIAARRR